MSNEAVCRTAPATPGLLITRGRGFVKANWILSELDQILYQMSFLCGLITFCLFLLFHQESGTNSLSHLVFWQPGGHTPRPGGRVHGERGVGLWKRDGRNGDGNVRKIQMKLGY